MNSKKPMVFVITPFNEDFLALFEEFKKDFGETFDFTNAGDLDNQQNILRDIVEGIANSDVIIADLTGLNANVFYELGLAHAMNKKVIIITQDIGELPFDIKSYRANQYSMQFNKLPLLIDELKKLLSGAMDGSIKYGNPVADYAPEFRLTEEAKPECVTMSHESASDDKGEESNNDNGFLDYISYIQQHSEKMNDELNSMISETSDMGQSVANATEDMNRVKCKSGNVDVSYVRNICRKLSKPINHYAESLKGHVENISENWDVIENSYLSLLDNKFVNPSQNKGELDNSKSSLKDLQKSINFTDDKIDKFIVSLQGNIGIERNLTKAINILILELQKYLTTTSTIYSSIDRISSKIDIIVTD